MAEAGPCLLDIGWADSGLCRWLTEAVAGNAVGTTVGMLIGCEVRGNHPRVLLERREHGPEEVLVGVQPLAHLQSEQNTSAVCYA